MLTLVTPSSARRWIGAGGGAIVLGAAVALSGSVTALVAPAILSVLLLAVLVRTMAWDSETHHRMLAWTIAAFFAHLVAGLFISNMAATVAIFRSDASTYHDFAKAIVDSWNSGLAGPSLPAGKEGFYYLLAGLYSVFGAHPAAGLVVNAALASALVPVLTDLTRRLFGAEAARHIAPIIVLMPGVFLWSSQLLKEAAIMFLVAVAANATVRMTEKVTLGPLVMATASLAILLTFRGHVALVMTAGFVAGMAFGKREVFAGLGTGLGALSLMAILVLAMGLGYSGYRSATDADLEQANVMRQDLALSANSGFDENVDISTARGALSYLPAGLISFGFGPFPWQIQGNAQLAMVPDVIAWWFLLPSLWRGHRLAWRRQGRRVLVLVLPALAATAILALVVGNFGTVVRERAQIIVLLAPLIALGLANRSPATTPVDQPGVEPQLVRA